VTTLLHRRLDHGAVNDLIATAPRPTSLTDDHHSSLRARFRAVSIDSHRRLDAWSVERAGRPPDPFRWSPTTARRTIGNAALLRRRDDRLTITNAVADEIAEQLLRATSGHARGGSLASWLASAHRTHVAIVMAESVNWATQLVDLASRLDAPWQTCATDAFVDVAGARTSLRARRDIEVRHGAERVLIRVRGGAPGKSAGPGLRADLVIDALADPAGLAPARYIGLWPDAGLCLAVDGSMDDLRAGARDLVRTAVAQRRARPAQAA
jgi:hypothetical protein